MNKKGEETFHVLFVGIMDVISIFLADRLSREGSRIFWLTPQQKPYVHQHFQARIYRRAITREAIRSMLRMHDIDTVVFHYGAYQGTDAEESVDESSIPALCALLEVLHGYKLRHFLYLSTEELAYFGETPRAAEMRFAESLVSYYARQDALPAIVLRLGMVYGKGDADGMGYIGRLVESLRDGRTLETRCHPESLVDPVYAGDVAMAAYELLLCDAQGTYHVLTGQPVTMDELHQTVSRLMDKPLNVTYLDQEDTPTEEEIFRLSLPLRQETGWMPMYLFHGRGQDMLREAVESAAQDPHRKERPPFKERFKAFWKRKTFLRGLAEVLILFAVTQLLLPYIHDSVDLRFVDVRLLFVMLCAIRYGMGLGLAAVGLASLSYVLALRQMGVDMSYLLYSVETWIPFIVYGVCGVAIGYSSDRRNDLLEEADKKYGALSERYDFLFALHKEVLETKRRLQRQLSSSKESFGKAYEVTERLSSLSPDKVLYASVDIFAEMMDSCQAAIWLLSPDNDFARLNACTSGLRDALPRTLTMSGLPALQQGFDSDGLFINRALDPAYPDLAAPIRRENRVIAFVSLHQLKPSGYTLHDQNLFRVLVGLTENSLLRALQYEEKLRREIYLPDTELLLAPELDKRLAIARQEGEKAHITLLVLEVRRAEGASLAELSAKLSRLMRTSDFAGVDASGRILAALTNAGEDDFEPIRRRFASAGVEVTPCSLS